MGRFGVTQVRSAEELVALGKRFATELPPNTILALSGELGAGKTTFVQGLAEGLGVEGPVVSPTFVLLNIYERLYHFDLYRLKEPADFLALGFDEYFSKGGICVIEWPERIQELLPPQTKWLRFAYSAEGRVVC